MIPINEKYRFILHDEVAIEDFEDGSLLLLCKQRRMIEINHVARYALNLLDGNRNLRQVIKKIACDFKIQEDEIREDIQKLFMDLGAHGAIRPLVRVMLKRRIKMDRSSSLLVNPDVSMREEEDGALLFNADTNSLQIINPIGLVILQFIKAHPRTMAEIVSHLRETCDNVPADQVEADVEQFITELHDKKFIGEVLDDKQLS